MPTGLVLGCLLPHPPVLLPEVGGAMARPVQPTVDAMRQVGRRIAAHEPDVVIVLSPHGPLLADRMGIGLSPAARGDFASFAAPQVQLSAECDVALAEALQAACARSALPLAAVDALTGPPREPGVYRLDHGAAVPLHILQPLMGRVPVVLLGFSALPRATHRAFGQRIRDVCEASSKRVVFVASGDLSHRLTPAAPAGYDPRGQVFDDAVLAAVSAGDWEALASIPEELVEAAGVCGYLSLLTLSAALGEAPASSHVLSYQGTYGVGYAVAEMVPV
ncbi:MAG: AmmeMemoRadiSam system protein B, partial [Chloroflexota bacterium]